MSTTRPTVGATPAPLPDDLQITVCDNCSQACCLLGEIMCWDSRFAGTKKLSVGELRALKREHSDYWEHDPNAIEWRKQQGVA